MAPSPRHHRPPGRGQRENEDSHRLCCVRGPEGIIVALAEQVG
jgi:hypothetical protein